MLSFAGHEYTIAEISTFAGTYVVPLILGYLASHPVSWLKNRFMLADNPTTRIRLIRVITVLICVILNALGLAVMKEPVTIGIVWHSVLSYSFAVLSYDHDLTS